MRFEPGGVDVVADERQVSAHAPDRLNEVASEISLAATGGGTSTPWAVIVVSAVLGLAGLLGLVVVARCDAAPN